MDRKEKRQKIDQAIKDITIPFLREKGFKGSFPHFRRQNKDGINLLTFQHSLYDTKFVVEIANCPPEGITTHWGKEISKNKVTAHDMGHRLRLGSEKHDTDYWFDYGKKSILTDVYKKIAKEIIELWDEAETWWKKDPFEQKQEIKTLHNN
ncbi:DUF4304 domain-containing protein [Cyclobacterium amurskyense]|uniref:DUF4304 domain-containing protein n=1 Tax=Cyclobacterium amurskyense TaxID=320787 RepID=UPI0030D75B22|tara:strand:- start:581 stop:1033 length:453 start_codon:yes stop_codon:yes gene_type:complete